MSEIIIQDKALVKMYEGNQYLIYPKNMRDVPLEMADMDKGDGEYHSVSSLERYAPISWKATTLNTDLEFVHYCFDEDGEKDKLKTDLITKGLVDIRPSMKVDGLSKTDFVANGFAIVSSREIKVIQALFKEDI